jgi:hypothetical protein
MKIYLAQVISNLDISKTGIVQISCPEEPRVKEAIYTSPYYAPYIKGGIFAVPEENSNILIAYNNKTNKAYYISTVLDDGGEFYDEKFPSPETALNDLRVTSMIPESYRIYNDFAPATMTFKNNEDNGLEIRNVNSTVRMINETKLVNERKHLTLASSPEIDSVILDNGHGDYLRIKGEPKSATGLPLEGSRSVEMKSELGHRYITNRGGIDIKIIEGKDITIENGSIGLTALNGILGPKSGNINLFSKYANIRLAAKGILGTQGSVIIETKTSDVIVTNAAITIRTDAGAEIEINGTTGAITLNSISNISMEAANISLDATGSIQMRAPVISIGGTNTTAVNVNSTAIVNIDGPTGLYLNSAQSIPAEPIPILPSANEAKITYLKTEYPTGGKYPI